MYHEGSCVEQTTGTPIDHVPGVIDLDQITGFDLAEGDAERVHPECAGIDWVTDGDVTCNSYSDYTD
jgi:hypothetical protein